MYTLCVVGVTYIISREYTSAIEQSDEAIAIATEKGAAVWRAFGEANKGCALALAGEASKSMQTLTAGISAFRSTGATIYGPICLLSSAKAHADTGNFDAARRSIDEAITVIETTKERWYEAEVHRISGEITLKSPEPDAAKAEAYFQRALSIARSQQAKSWELRTAVSMARLWRNQGKRDEARELLAPVYGWFTEGFDTRDLKEAKALLAELAA
jgi:predicted ATPase